MMWNKNSFLLNIIFKFKAIFDEFWNKVALKVANVSMHKTNRKSVATGNAMSNLNQIKLFYAQKKKLLNNSAAKIGEQNVNI